MAKAGAQHELVGVIVDRYPEVVYGIAAALGLRFPEHDLVTAAPNGHQVRKKNPIHTDATVRMVKDGKPVHFAQVEMQGSYSLGKLTTLPAYHGSGVRNFRCGGQLIVLSSKASVTRSFRRNEALSREELAYRVAFGSSAELAPLREPDRTFAERMVAAAVTDFEDGIPASAVRMIAEAQDQDEPLMADMLASAIMEGCADPLEVEEALASELAMARMAQLPSVQKMLAQARAAAQEKAEAAAARAQQDARAAEERARAAEEKNREDVARAKLEMAAGSLREYFVAKGEALTVSALKRISACTDLEVLRSWQMRAYRGETAAEIFSGDENGEDPAAST